jgi:hypothetical protein
MFCSPVSRVFSQEEALSTPEGKPGGTPPKNRVQANGLVQKHRAKSADAASGGGRWTLTYQGGPSEAALNNSVTNVTAQIGGAAFLPCRVGHLGDRQVYSISVFLDKYGYTYRYKIQLCSNILSLMIWITSGYSQKLNKSSNFLITLVHNVGEFLNNKYVLQTTPETYAAIFWDVFAIWQTAMKLLLMIR